MQATPPPRPHHGARLSQPKLRSNHAHRGDDHYRTSDKNQTALSKRLAAVRAEDDMNVRYFEELKQAFIAGTPELKKIIALLQNSFDKVEIRADCADHFSREFESVDDLINYENPMSEEIRSLRLLASTWHLGSYSSAVVKFERSSKKITIAFTASEEVASRLKREIRNIIVGMRPWYDVLSRINVGWIFGTLLNLLWCIVVLRYVSKFIEDKVIFGTMWLLSIIVSFAILLFVGHKLRIFLFSQAVFTIGQGKSRFRDKERIQWSVVISFLVSLAAGLVILTWQAIAGLITR